MSTSPYSRVIFGIGAFLELAALIIGLASVWGALAPAPPPLAAGSSPTPALPALTPFPTLKPIPTGTPAPAPTATPLPLPDSAEVPIMFYHYVGDLPADADAARQELTVLPGTFEAQLQYLVDAGYHTITLSDLYGYLSGGWPLPEKAIILTFDDGYRDAYDNAFPLLKKYGFVGTFFILSTLVDAEDPAYLTWAMIEEMAAAGMDIEGHGRDHVGLAGQPYDFVLDQVQGVKGAIEAHTSRPVRFFCYPYGQYDWNAIAALQAAGYWGAVTTWWGRIHTRESLFALDRVRVSGGDGVDGFAFKVSNGW